MPITIRNINKETDLESFIEFYNLAHADYPEHQDLTVEIAKQYIFDAPNFDVEGNFLALDGSRIIGKARADIRAGIGSISICILPELRFTGIEDQLYEAIMNYLAHKDVNKVWALILSQFEKEANFYKSKGFQDKNRMYDMVRDMGLPVEASKLPDGIIIDVPDLEKEYDAVRETIVKGFAESTDDIAEMMEQYDSFTKKDYFSKDGIFAARDSDGNILGICVAATHPAMKDKGFIPWLTVLKEARGKGIGKALLLSSLEWFSDMDNIKKADLAVDLDNPRALELYKGIGFEVVTEMVQYEKKLKQ